MNDALSTKYTVIQSRTSDYPEPIQLKKGDIVQKGRESSEKDGWTGWIFCTKDTRSGWVPQQIIENNENEMGVLLEEYTAHELNITVGDVIVAEKEINGWLWGFKVNDEKNKGWVPLEHVKSITE